MLLDKSQKAPERIATTLQGFKRDNRFTMFANPISGAANPSTLRQHRSMDKAWKGQGHDDRR